MEHPTGLGQKDHNNSDGGSQLRKSSWKYMHVGIGKDFWNEGRRRVIFHERCSLFAYLLYVRVRIHLGGGGSSAAGSRRRIVVVQYYSYSDLFDCSYASGFGCTMW